MIALDSALKVATLVSIVAGGLWAYFRYVRQRLGVWNLQMTITPEVVAYAPQAALLMVRLNLKNVGSIRIVPGSNGCTISIRQLPLGLPEYQSVSWDTGVPRGEEFDMLSQYKKYSESPDYEHEVYSLDPGCEYREQHGIIVPHGFVYLIQVTFWARHNRDSSTEYSYCRVEGGSQAAAPNISVNSAAGADSAPTGPGQSAAGRELC